MVWSHQEELEWSGHLLGSVLLLLMYGRVSLLCVYHARPALEMESVAVFWTDHFLPYATQNLTLKPETICSLVSQLGDTE